MKFVQVLYPAILPLNNNVKQEYGHYTTVTQYCTVQNGENEKADDAAA